MKGLGNRSWCTDFVQVSEASGLPLSRFTDGEGPLLPAPSPESRWGSRGVTSSELGEWMCSILASPDALKPTSHSLKATMLSILVKWGCNPDTVLILGHHAPRQRGLSMVHTYGRDVQAAPIRELERCLSDVRTGRFRPDCSRSGMVTDSPPVVSVSPTLPSAVHPGDIAAQQAPEWWHQKLFVRFHLRHRTQTQAPRTLHQTRSIFSGGGQGHTILGEKGVLSIGTSGPRRCTCFRRGVRPSCVVASVLKIMLCTVAPSSRLLRSASSATPAVPSRRLRD